MDSAPDSQLKMITTSEAASALGITQAGVRYAIEMGYLRGRKVIPPGGSPLRPLFMVPEVDIESYKREHQGVRSPGGNLRVPKEEREEMEGRGYLTIRDAANLVGINPQYLRDILRRGGFPTEKRVTTWVEKIYVLSIKKSRDRKIAAAGGAR